MRSFHDGDTILIEPWHARAFPLIQDLMVDRSAFDRIIQAGGYVDVHAGGAPDANVVLIGKAAADQAMDVAACIGCGACVAACPNASASLFVAAKISHLGLLPQGQPERDRRAVRMVEQMDLEGFGNCGWYGECQTACPKEISIDTIVQMDRDYTRAMLSGRDIEGGAGRPGRRATAASIDEPPRKPNADGESVLGGRRRREDDLRDRRRHRPECEHTDRSAAGCRGHAVQSPAVGDRADRRLRRRGLCGRHRAVGHETSDVKEASLVGVSAA